MKTELESKDQGAKNFKTSDLMPPEILASLKIGYDGKRALQNFTGLGNYSRYIIEILSEYFPKNQYEIYSSKFTNDPRTLHLQKLSSVAFHISGKSFFSSLWRSFGIIKDLKNDKIQIYHGLSNEIPFGIEKTNIRSVVTIHDLIFLRYPAFYPWFDRQLYNIKFRYACRNADRIIAVSQQTKKDIIKFFGIPKSRIEVIYQNCSPIFYSKVSPEERKRIASAYNLPEKYLLNVGSIEERKNLLLIVKALKNVSADIHLVVAGKETSYIRVVKQYIAENQLAKRVHFLKNVIFTDLPGIYQQTEIFIYPSKFEGFGIPIIEALHSGIPVIAATGSCLEEAGGPGSLYVNPADENELADSINYILKHPEEKQKMITLGSEFVKQFSNQIIAKKLTDLYQNVITDAKRRG